MDWYTNLEESIKLLLETEPSKYDYISRTLSKGIKLFWPKKSKNLGINLSKKLFSVKDNLSLIIIGHLYIERMLVSILEKKLKNYHSIDKSILNSFYKKVIFLKSQEFISKRLADDILVFNDLRNKFAHKLNYQLSEFDLSKFSFCNSESETFRKMKIENKESFSLIAIRSASIHFLLILSEDYKYIYDLIE